MGNLVRLGLAGSLVVLLMYPVSAAAQRQGAEVGRFEVHGMDFRPNGAWRKRVGEIRAARKVMLSIGAFGQLNPAAGVGGAMQVTGAFNVPVILVRPGNVPAPFVVSEYQEVLFTPTPGAVGRAYSLKTYYEELSNDLITMDGTVFDWVQLSETDSYYEDGCNGIGVESPCPNDGVHFAEMLVEALDSVSLGSDSMTVWTEFDNDGPDGIPNSGDDDGFVDFVTFLQPEIDGACGTSNIWAHRFFMRGWLGSPYTTRTPKTGGGFIQVDDYTMQSGVGGGSSGCQPGPIMQIGTIAHETGHAFGLPDLYDTSGDGEGIGEWGLMGSGNYATQDSPARMSAWSLMELGWINAVPLTTSGTVGLGPVASNDTIRVVTGSPGEYWILENRQSQESDVAQMSPSFGSRQKSPGLLIWHIDQNKVNSGGPDNSINSGTIQGVKLEQADGQEDLQAASGGNRGDTGDSWPGSTNNVRYSYSTTPASRLNTGEPSGFVLDNITQIVPGGAVQFDFLTGAPNLVVQADVLSVRVRVEGTSYSLFEDIFPSGSMVAVSADSVQTVSGGRTRATFQSWSNAGALSQTVTTTAAVQTLTADFLAEHIIKVAAPGGGSVSASTTGGPLPDSLLTGVFVAPGAPVTLVATPGAGVTFNGWSGDTTASAATLVLPMERGYILTANFLATVAVAPADAISEILGTPTLTAQQKTFLDQQGNNNSVYDLGDFLALSDRTGLNPAPVLQKLSSTAPAKAPPAGGKE